MLAWMNRDTLAETLEKRIMVYFSRSRNKRWMKGETSGHVQTVREVYIDCDGDALLFKIERPALPATRTFFPASFAGKATASGGS